jgi:hypothetical protein
MTHRRAPLAALLVLPLVLLTAPAHAQEADTTAADPLATDTTATDTTRAAPPDTAAADTAMADLPPADTTQAPTTSDTLATDTMAVADTAAADTALSAEARRERAKKRARTAAEAWLSLTDDGQFGASWDEAASSLQNSVSREAWQKRGTQARATLDSLKNRELTSAVYRDSTMQIPGDAPVVALRYSTDFEGGRTLEAVITAKQNTDWKVAGYRVVPAPADSAQAPNSTQASPAPDSIQNQPEPDSTQGR